jgi:soluble lytic murein transglycosylase
LDSWIAAGKLTGRLVWQRFDMAMHAGQTKLAKYVKRYPNNSDLVWADRWLSLHSNPSNWSQLIGKTHPKRDEMATQAIRRLAYKDVDQAFTAWRKLNASINFSDLQHLKIARSLMGQLTRQETSLNNRQITALLPKRYLTLDSKLSDKQIQFALQNGDWQGLLNTLDSIPLKEQESERWQYWRARALINLGRKGEGESIFTKLSNERSYYGFLAAMRLGNRPKLLHEALDTDLNLTTQLSQLAGLKRAKELHALNRSLQARREWNLALKGRDDEQLKAAVRLAEQWSWPSQAIITLAKLRFWNDLELRFPLTHQKTVTTLANAQGIDRAWVYAILRQESAFMADAKSRVGARGLMQLMPKTAKEVAKDLSETINYPDELYQPELNIKLGTSYLNKVYRQLQENPVLATAAYNAGPFRVQAWLPEKTQAADIWIETVPFHETREYLKRVLAYTVIYNYRLGLDPAQSSSSWLQPIEGQETEVEGSDTAVSGV